MKALILHANRWEVNVESPSQRIGNCEPEELHYDINDDEGTGEGPPHPLYALATEHMEECLVVLFHIEKEDSTTQAELLCRDIKLLAKKVGTQRLMVSGFAHLSHSRPDPTVAKQLFLQIVATCKGWSHYEVRSSHFGWNKSLLLDIKGHQGAFNFRDYPGRVALEEQVNEQKTKRAEEYAAQKKSDDEKELTRQARIARRAARREEHSPERGN